MALKVAGVKKAVNLSWDSEQVGGEACRIIARNEETGAISNTNWSRDDGYGVLTYPLDYEGTTKVLIEGTGGGTESATIEITADGASVSPDNGEPVEPPDTTPPDPDQPLEIWGPAGPWIDVLPS